MILSKSIDKSCQLPKFNFLYISKALLKALVVKNSVLHDFGFGKVSRIHETFLMELQLFGWRHFSKTEVVQNTVLNH